MFFRVAFNSLCQASQAKIESRDPGPGMNFLLFTKNSKRP